MRVGERIVILTAQSLTFFLAQLSVMSKMYTVNLVNKYSSGFF